MSSPGDIAVLKLDDNSRWRWVVLTPSVLSTLSFNSGTTPSLVASGAVMTADTGWTANNTAGDKTAALSSYSNGLNGTMVTALNVVSGGTGTVLSAAMDVIVILVKKVAALETALAANKLPNV